MKKLLLLLLCVATYSVAVEDIPNESRWEKVKTVLTSKPAKITYGVLGVLSSSACIGLIIYGKKVAPFFDELIDSHHKSKTTKNPYGLLAKYKLENAKVSIGVDFYGDKTYGFTITVDNQDQSKLKQLVRDGKLARWFTKEYGIPRIETSINETKITVYYTVKK